MLSSLIIWGMESNQGVAYIDALFLAVSAVTDTGLITLDTQELNVWTQVFIVFLMIVCHAVFQSIILVYARRRAYYSAIQNYADENKILVHNVIDEGSDLDIELHALDVLLILLPMFWFFWLFMGSIFAGICIIGSEPSIEVFESRNISIVWGSVFLSSIAWTNSGFSPLNDSLISLAPNTWILALLALLTFVGNTAYPVVLRLYIRIVQRIILCLPNSHLQHGKLNTTIKKILDHPRIFYTHLFKRKMTTWLTLVFIALNAFQFFFNIGVEWNEPVYYNHTTSGKLAAAFLTCAASRHTGYNTVAIGLLQPVTKWIILVMMHLAPHLILVPIQLSPVLEGHDNPKAPTQQSATGKLQRTSFVLPRQSIVLVPTTNPGTSGRTSIALNRTSFVGMRSSRGDVSDFFHAGSSGKLGSGSHGGDGKVSSPGGESGGHKVSLVSKSSQDGSPRLRTSFASNPGGGGGDSGSRRGGATKSDGGAGSLKQKISDTGESVKRTINGAVKGRSSFEKFKDETPGRSRSPSPSPGQATKSNIPLVPTDTSKRDSVSPTRSTAALSETSSKNRPPVDGDQGGPQGTHESSVTRSRSESPTQRRHRSKTPIRSRSPPRRGSKSFRPARRVSPNHRPSKQISSEEDSRRGRSQSRGRSPERKRGADSQSDSVSRSASSRSRSRSPSPGTRTPRSQSVEDTSSIDSTDQYVIRKLPISNLGDETEPRSIHVNARPDVPPPEESESSHETVIIQKTAVDEDEAVWFEPQTVSSDIKHQARNMLTDEFPIWFFLTLCIFISEESQFDNGDFTMFNVLFEMVSAFGNNGMSFGYTGLNTSLSTVFSTFGKLVIIVMMLVGRHRSVPSSRIDNSIRLPQLLSAQQDAEKRRAGMELPDIERGRN